MTAKVLGGSWPEGASVSIQRGFTGKVSRVRIVSGLIASEAVLPRDVAAADLVTADNYASIAGKVGWGALGVIALGPLGLLAGVLGGGNKRERVVSLVLRDGRKALIKCGPKEAEALLALGYGAMV